VSLPIIFKSLIAAFISITISGCALSTSNQIEMGNGKYSVTATGNAWDNYETLFKTINKKAVTLCGDSNFLLGGKSPVVVTSMTIYTGGEAPVKELTRMVTCEP
jgi:hypothetical protein